MARKQVLPVSISLARDIEVSGKILLELLNSGNPRMKSIITNVIRPNQSQEGGGNTLPISMTLNSLRYQERARRRRTKRIGGQGHRKLISFQRNSRTRRESHPNGKRVKIRCRTALFLEIPVLRSFLRTQRVDYMEIVHESPMTMVSHHLTARTRSNPLQPQMISLITSFSYSWRTPWSLSSHDMP